MVVVPPFYIATDEELKWLRDYVEQEGHLYMLFHSGFADPPPKKIMFFQAGGCATGTRCFFNRGM